VVEGESTLDLHCGYCQKNYLEEDGEIHFPWVDLIKRKSHLPMEACFLVARSFIIAWGHYLYWWDEI
jgi:hypothetical protein